MSSMPPIPNLKTFTLSCIKPVVFALSKLFDESIKYMRGRLDLQDTTVFQLQDSDASLEQQMAELQARQLATDTEVHDLQISIPTLTDLAAYNRRVEELNFLSSALYDKVYELMALLGSTDTLPSFTNPVLPSDTEVILTEVQLEEAWRLAANISAGTNLSAAQRNDLKGYIDTYYTDRNIIVRPT